MILLAGCQRTETLLQPADPFYRTSSFQPPAETQGLLVSPGETITPVAEEESTTAFGFVPSEELNVNKIASQKAVSAPSAGNQIPILTISAQEPVQADDDQSPQTVGPAIDEISIEIPPDQKSLLPIEARQANNRGLALAEVLSSVQMSYPMVEAAYLNNDIADGKRLAAEGSFDTKFKASSENGPTGFYQTYRNKAGVTQPLFNGGEVFGGYRIGRGDFQPWYQERQTNDAGEFKAGVRIPLLRNREIDRRRAELWRATFDQQITRPEIRGQLISFQRDASYAYWFWIAAGQHYEVGRRALELARQRTTQLEKQEKAGALNPPVLQDNLRAIAKRESKLLDLERKFKQTAIKLSLYYRAADGTPQRAAIEQLMEFPLEQKATFEQTQISEDRIALGVQTALQMRPELTVLDTMYRRARVDLAAAQNDFLPAIDAMVSGSQDLGEPTSSKRDKSEFELDAGVFVDVPIQRRKARGKSQAAAAKMQQILAKKRLTEQKIVTEVRAIGAALQAAAQRIERASEARKLAEYMARIERRKFELGQSDLLKVVIREQYAVDAAVAEVDAKLEFSLAESDFSAALASDFPVESVPLNEQ